MATSLIACQAAAFFRSLRFLYWALEICVGSVLYQWERSFVTGDSFLFPAFGVQWIQEKADILPRMDEK